MKSVAVERLRDTSLSHFVIGRSWLHLKHIRPSANVMADEIIVSDLRIPSPESCSCLVLILSLVRTAYLVGGMMFTECQKVSGESSEPSLL